MKKLPVTLLSLIPNFTSFITPATHVNEGENPTTNRTGSTKIVDLRTEYQKQPIGIDAPSPRFSWRMESNIVGQEQKAYEIKLYKASEPDKIIWSTDKVESGLSVGITYDGVEFDNATVYGWNVRVWDAKGNVHSPEPAYFETGVTVDQDWLSAEFISLTASSSAPIFRTEQGLDGEVASARLYITAIGVYEAYINGAQVGKINEDETIFHHMNPGYGNGDVSLWYQAYDVTTYLQDSEAVAVSIMAGNGWSDGRGGGVLGTTVAQPAVKAMLTVNYTSGAQKKIVTNTTDWTGTLDGPITVNGVYYGEDYDARKVVALGDFHNVGYDDSGWIRELTTTSYSGEIVAQRGEPGYIVDAFEQQPQTVSLYTGKKAASACPGGEIEIDEQFVGVDHFAKGVTLKKGQTMVVNMGQNITAIPDIEFQSIPGAVVSMRFGEMLNDGSSVGNGDTQADGPKGSIYFKSLRDARASVNYTFATDELERYQTKMSFFGYQYVQITATEDVRIYSLRSRAVSSVGEQTGHITTNNENVNRLFLNALHGQISNYFTTITDTPARDERLAWTGDAQVFAQTGVYNFDAVAFMNGYQNILSENTLKNSFPGAVTAYAYGGFFSHWATGWSDVQIIVPWVLYQQTNDASIIEENWTAMIRYMDYLKDRERAAYQSQTVDRQAFSDWLAFQGTGPEVMADYYYGYVTSLMANMAEATGRDEEAEAYRVYFENIKQKFIETHIEFQNDELDNVDARFIIKSGIGSPSFMGKAGRYEHNSQTALLWMLKLGFYNSDEMRDEAIRLLIKNIRNENPQPGSTRDGYGQNTLSVGFLGSNVIAPVLSEIGRPDVSYDLVLQDGMPSWLFTVKAGGTTMWERWNSFSPGIGFGDAEMNSFNHFAYGAVAEWMYQYMAGISTDNQTPGFKRIVLQPTLDTGIQYNDEQRINQVTGSYHSYYGMITSAWTSDKGKLSTYYATIPANTTAVLYLPVTEEQVADFNNINGVSYVGITEHNGAEAARFEMKAGGYHFIVQDNKLTVSIADGFFSSN